VALLGIGFYNKEVSWEVAIASITSVVVLVYNLNGWNKSEERVEELETMIENKQLKQK
jgi:hypothetical protein